MALFLSLVVCVGGEGGGLPIRWGGDSVIQEGEERGTSKVAWNQWTGLLDWITGMTFGYVLMGIFNEIIHIAEVNIFPVSRCKATTPTQEKDQLRETTAGTRGLQPWCGVWLERRSSPIFLVAVSTPAKDWPLCILLILTSLLRQLMNK